MVATRGAGVTAPGSGGSVGATPAAPHVPIGGTLGVVLLVYLLTGVMQPTLVDWVKYTGAAGMSSPPAMLTLLSNTLGMALVVRVARLLLPWSPAPLRRQLVVALEGPDGVEPEAKSSSKEHTNVGVSQDLVIDVADGGPSQDTFIAHAANDDHHIRMRGGVRHPGSEVGDANQQGGGSEQSELGGSHSGRGVHVPSLPALAIQEPQPAIDLFDRRVLVPTAVDLCSGVLVMMGLLVVGSGVYVVIYSSCTAWTAVLSRLFLRRRLARMQWLGVALCTLGLAANGLASAFHTPTGHVPEPRDSDMGSGQAGWGAPREAAGGVHGPGDAGPESSVGDGRVTFHQQEASTLVLGGLLVLAGSILHSAMFVMVEAGADAGATGAAAPALTARSPALPHTLDTSANAVPQGDTSARSDDVRTRGVVPPLQMCSRMGTLEACIVAAWITAVTVWYSPRQVILSQLAAHQTPIGSAVVLYILLTATNCLHALSFFLLIGRLGAVGSSVLKGLHAVLVFAFSATMYCGYQPSQCATWLKTSAMLLVLAGTLVYVRGGAATSR